MGDWPDATGLPTPVVYVGPATGPRTPTGEAPLADIASALERSPRPGAVIVGRGTYALTAAIQISSAITLRGAGMGVTLVTAPAGADALTISTPGAARFEVTLEGFTVQGPASGEAGVGVRVVGHGATVTLRDVEVTRESEGLRVEDGGTVCAEGLTVRGATRYGVTLTDDSHAYLRSVLVRDGAGAGVFVRRSHLAMETALVADNARDGVVFSGGTRGAECMTDGDCAAVDTCFGLRHEQVCVASLALPASAAGPALPAERRCRSVSTLAHVAVLRNQVTGLRAERTPPTTEESADRGLLHRILAAPGPVVRASRVVVAGTRAPAGMVGGYGVYVGPTSNVSFDTDITDEFERGLGSAIVDNANAGVLADGDPFGPDGGLVIGDAAIPGQLGRAGTLHLSGAIVGSNRGPGTFVQRRAVAQMVSYSTFSDNAAIGLGVSSGVLANGFCDQFINTRPGTIAAATPGAAAIRLGDGASFADTTAQPEAWRAPIETVFVDSEFTGNSRYGFVLSGGAVTFRTLRTGNVSTRNLYGLGTYGVTMVNGSLRQTANAAAAPPTLQGSATDYSRSAAR